MSTVTEAEGLLDWHRLKELEGQDYLNEDESWLLHSLRDKYDCHPPRPPVHHARPFTYEEHLHFEGGRFMRKVWADEIVMAYKDNLVMNAILNTMRRIDDGDGED